MIYINLCVDWEGEHFRDLGALRYLLSEMGDKVPVTHFICPAYFYHFPTKGKQQIQCAIRPGDEIGLHVHCYKSLIKHVEGVVFKTRENYYKKNDPLIRGRDRLLKLLPRSTREKILDKVVSGRGVPLSVYSFPEIKKIIAHARDILVGELQLAGITAFRAGGWIASDEVMKALMELGTRVDSSAVAPGIVSNGYDEDTEGTGRDDFNEQYPTFTRYIKQLWGDNVLEEGFLKNAGIHAAMPSRYITRTEQPFRIGQLVEMPNNCGATDFASLEKTFLPVLRSLVEENARHENQKPFFINISCHQEGDFFYKKGMLAFYEQVTALSSPGIQFTTVSHAARVYEAYYRHFSGKNKKN
jgi:hypothetical protein